MVQTDAYSVGSRGSLPCSKAARAHYLVSRTGIYGMKPPLSIHINGYRKMSGFY